MGLIDSLKKTTGIGLDAQGAYDRAYEKGVLQGEEHYSDAIELFGKAAEKAEAHEEHELAARARANAALYSYITRGGLEYLRTLQGLLDRFPEIERPGSNSEMMPTAPLLAEINARLAEAEADGLSEPSVLVEAHDRAAAAFKGIFNAELQTYRWQAVDQHIDKASDRFHLHTGLAGWNRAVLQMDADPSAATEHMAKALDAFESASDSAWAAKADEWLARGRARRTCWMCHREVQGAGTHFHLVSARVTPYAVRCLEELGQDGSAIDFDRDQLTLCTPCHSAVQRLADQAAAEREEKLRGELTKDREQLRDEATKEREKRKTAVEDLDKRLRRLEKHSHKH